MPKIFQMLDLMLIKVLQGHYHSHFAAEETKAQARKWQIQDLHWSGSGKICVFALLSAPPELAFLISFHEIVLFFSNFYLG